jgi:hypothetical protein
MMNHTIHRPDEAALARDLGSGRFRTGVAMGRWRQLYFGFPYVVIAVTAADESEIALRFECGNYPQAAVTAQPWDALRGVPLARELWPKGTSRIPLAFNPDWKGGTCLYLPCDRQSIEGHDHWRMQHPALLWEPARGICKYLGIVHQLLNTADYGGRLASVA